MGMKVMTMMMIADGIITMITVLTNTNSYQCKNNDIYNTFDNIPVSIDNDNANTVD